VVARLDLADMPDVLTALSGREASVRRLDELRARFGDHPSAWWPHLIGTPWPGPLAKEPPQPRLRVAP
jgi:type IV secretion system protein VirB4